MALNFNRIEAVILEAVDPEIHDQTFEPDDLYMKLMRGRGKRTNDRGVRIPSKVRQNASFGGFGDGGILLRAGQPEYIEMKVYPVNLFSSFEITGNAVANLKTDDALIGKLSEIIEDASFSAKSKINDAIPGDGTGEIARVKVRDSGTQCTMASTYAEGNVFGAMKMIVGAFVQFVAPDGTLRSATASEVTGSDPGTHTVTFDSVPGAVAPGDIVVYEGSYLKYPSGFEKLIAGGNGIIQGASRQTYPVLRSFTQDMQGAAPTVAKLTRARSMLKFKSKRKDRTTLLSAPGLQDSFETQGHNLVRFTRTGTMKLDFEGVSHGKNGNGWDESVSVPYHTIFGIDWSEMHKYELEKFGILKGDGLSMRQGFTSTGRRKDTLEGHVGCRLDVGTPMPLAHFRQFNYQFEDQATGPLANV